MKHSEELKRLEEDLRGSEEIQKKLDEACRRIATEGKSASDGEIMVAAAKELGYDISIAALEQARAEAEKALDVPHTVIGRILSGSGLHEGSVISMDVTPDGTGLKAEIL